MSKQPEFPMCANCMRDLSLNGRNDVQFHRVSDTISVNGYKMPFEDACCSPECWAAWNTLKQERRRF